MELPDDITLEIVEKYLDFDSLKNLIKVNKEFNKISYLSYRNRFVRAKFPEKILDVLQFNNQYPLLKYKNSFFGGTDYLDGVLLEDVSAPIMLSIDINKRPMMTFRMKCNNKYILQTFFQRYSNDYRAWSMGTGYRYTNAIGENYLKKEECNMLKNLIKNKKITRNLIDYGTGDIYEKFEIELI